MTFNMKSTSSALLIVFVLAVKAQDPDSRTYGYYSHAGHTHGHHGHGVPHHHHHPPSAHHQGPTHGSHQHHGIPPTSGTLQSPLQAQQHQPFSVPAQATTNVRTVPYMVCRIVQLPVGPLISPVPALVPKASSMSPQQVFHSLTASIGDVFGRVINPMVSLLNSPSSRLNHTAPGPHNHTAHPPHPNHTVLHGQNSALPHHDPLNFTTPNGGVVQKNPAKEGDVNHDPAFPLSEVPTTTSSPTPAVTTAAFPTTTVRVPVLKSNVCDQGPTPGVPAQRAYPSTTPDSTVTWTDNPTAIPKQPTSELYQEVTTAANTVLRTTLADTLVSFPADRT
ncbi:uncharacterized protein LOC142796474 [Rhipicephalus microplus]|uniref:uncharacterized protein LOC142796474 n=1 Tax=Rhipicephalus microplus TaxID=6941 RepID=UPI003F6B9E87